MKNELSLTCYGCEAVDAFARDDAAASIADACAGTSDIDEIYDYAIDRARRSHGCPTPRHVLRYLKTFSSVLRDRTPADFEEVVDEFLASFSVSELPRHVRDRLEKAR